MKKELVIDGKTFDVEISADLVRIYRIEFGSEVFTDLQKATQGDLSCIENLAYVMVKAADPSIKDLSTWLKSFDNPFAVIQSSGRIISLWTENLKTTSKAVKK